MSLPSWESGGIGHIFVAGAGPLALSRVEAPNRVRQHSSDPQTDARTPRPSRPSRKNSRATGSRCRSFRRPSTLPLGLRPASVMLSPPACRQAEGSTGSSSRNWSTDPGAADEGCHRERELLEPIQTKVNSVIEGVRAAGNYAVIFDVSAPNNGIVTADKSLDLTQRIIQQLKAGS